jgi:hypothetical protein
MSGENDPDNSAERAGVQDGPLVVRPATLPVLWAAASPSFHTNGRIGGGCWLLPGIEIAGRQLRDVTDDALDALALANHPPSVFRRAGVLVRLHLEETTDKVLLQPLIGKVLRNHLARVADWFRRGVPTAPPSAVVSDIEVEADFAGLPALDAVVTCPVATPRGGLITRAGYHEQARLWFQPDHGLVVPPVPTDPSKAEVHEAREFIEGNLFADFPFVAPCDRAVAWAALVLPFVRPVIGGPTPLHLFTAPAPGTGKTLLAQVVMAPAMGQQDLEPMTVDCEESEMRKRLTSCLLGSPTGIIFMDNLGQGRRLESSSLASILTASTWRDRILGSSVMASLPVGSVCWLATGNNPLLSDELTRKTVRSRLDAGTRRPHMRQGFRHPEILRWAKENRAALLECVLTLVRAWQAAGQPGTGAHLGMFESWCKVVGGLLDVAGVEGLQHAIEQFQKEETDAEQAVAPFLEEWWQRHGAAEVGVKDLYEVAVAAGNLEAVLEVHQSGSQRQRARGAETERSLHTRLGSALRRLTGQVYAGFQVKPTGVDRCGRQMYQLMRVE